MKHHRSTIKRAILVLALPCLTALPPAARGGEKAAGAGSGHEFQMMDADKDGKVSESEHSAGAKKMFDMMDADKDGKVSTAEMDAAHEKVTGKAADKAAGAGKRPPHMTAAEKIKVVDTNKDGQLSADEHAAGSRMMFEKMDANKDGFLTQTELEAGHAKMMSKTTAKAGDKPAANK